MTVEKWRRSNDNAGDHCHPDAVLAALRSSSCFAQLDDDNSLERRRAVCVADPWARVGAVQIPVDARRSDAGSSTNQPRYKWPHPARRERWARSAYRSHARPPIQ